MGMTIKDLRDNLTRERDVVKNMLADMKAMRAAIKQSRKNQKELRARLKEERAFNRMVKSDNRRIEREKRAQKQAERMHARIAKTEARLEALRLKALSPKQTRKSQQKAGPVKVWSAEEIASFEAARHG